MPASGPPQGDDGLRCFVACEIDEATKAAIRKLQSSFRGLDRAVRWARPEQMHLTLKFLGEVAEAKVPAVCRAVKEAAVGCRRFGFRLEGVGCFPPGGGAVRVVWVGVQDESGEVARCYESVEQRMAVLGFPRETRRFSPHLTIGRVKDRSASAAIRKRIESLSFDAREQHAAELVLFESHLAPSGARYTPICREALAGG